MSLFKRKPSKDGVTIKKTETKKAASRSKKAATERDIELENSVYEDLLRSVEESEARMRANDTPAGSLEIPAQEHPVTAETKSATGIGGIGFVSDSLNKYETPDFKANLHPETKDHDVTSPIPAIGEKASAVENFDATISQPSIRPATTRGRADIGSMRLDVARISADIQSGEELYRRAQTRIENLTQFVERAEIDFSMLNRLEPENRRLKARNKTITAELNDKDRKVSILEADLEDHRQRLAERTQISEQAQSRLAQATKSLQEYERVLRQTQEESDQTRLRLERNQTAMDVERRENEILRGKVSELSEVLDARGTETIEAKKMADSLREDCADFRSQATRYEADNVELRNALDAALKQNNAMKGEMVSLHEDIRNFKTQYEFNVIAREDQITALESQISELSRQLEIKDEIVRNAARDVSDLRKLRTSQDLERDRLEKIIDSQNYQLEEAQNALLQSKHDASEFDRRYRDVAAALSMTQNRQAGEVQTEQAGIPEGLAAELPDTRFDDFSDEDIEDRIMDYKLGLRTDIA